MCYANVEQHFTPASDRICAAIHLHARQILLIKKLSQCHNQSNCLLTEVINAITHEFILLAAALITLCLCVDLLTSCQLPVASLEWLQIAAGSSNGPSLACVVREQIGLDTQRGRRRDKAVANWAASGGKWKATEICSNFATKFAATFTTIFGAWSSSLYIELGSF